MKIDNLFSELKRRNVYKVAAAYTVVGWLLVQVATQVFPFFEIPNWAVRLIVLAIVIGFPIALVIAWALLGRAYGLAGRKDEARRILERLHQSRAERYTAAYSLALVNVGLGDRDEALNWLEESYRERDGNNIAQIRIDPLLVSLHGNPRFEALAEKIVPGREFHTASK